MLYADELDLLTGESIIRGYCRMALLEALNIEKSEDVVRRRHEGVKSRVAFSNAIDESIGQIIQIDSFGSPGRQKADTLSQTMQIELSALSEIYNQAKKHFGILKNCNSNSIEAYSPLPPKPFLILAGPSGTGKSRWVRKQAYAYWPQRLEGTDLEMRPPNYELISVRPNWHDSSEVLGYISRVGGLRYVLTDFVRFLVKAWSQWQKEMQDAGRKEHPTPFFLCLDEMNLAPVEQYFAEYLSVVETRKTASKNVFGDAIPVKGYVVSDPLIGAGEFEKLQDASWTAFCIELKLEEKDPVAAMLRQHGLTLPPNLYVVGTVNMDETTHSFSRKVLDRAFVWEMPIGDLARPASLDGGDKLEYKNQHMELPKVTEGWQVYGELGGADEGSMATGLLAKLLDVNDRLQDTPFQVSYRVRDELLLLAASRGVADEKSLWQCLDDGFYSKILPRIEGDESRTRKALEALLAWLLPLSKELPDSWTKLSKALENNNYSQALRDAKVDDSFLVLENPADPFSRVQPWRRSLAKVRSMLLKLEGQFTSFWD